MEKLPLESFSVIKRDITTENNHPSFISIDSTLTPPKGSLLPVHQNMRLSSRHLYGDSTRPPSAAFTPSPGPLP
jgi:hypothetical protein